jgi:hypothetical protein
MFLCLFFFLNTVIFFWGGMGGLLDFEFRILCLLDRCTTFAFLTFQIGSHMWHLEACSHPAPLFFIFGDGFAVLVGLAPGL